MSERPTQAEKFCPECLGNDGDKPCLYPGEWKQGCLRDKRLDEANSTHAQEVSQEMNDTDEVLKYPTDVSSIDDAHAVIKWAGIESTEYTDCAILYEVTFDQLRLMYDMGRQKESKLSRRMVAALKAKASEHRDGRLSALETIAQQKEEIAKYKDACTSWHTETFKLKQNAQDEINRLEEQKLVLSKKCEELKQREAELVDACNSAINAFVTQVGSDYNDIVHSAYLKCRDAISNPTEHTERFMAEIQIAAQVKLKRELQAIQDDGSCLCASCAQYVERIAGHMANELRSGK